MTEEVEAAAAPVVDKAIPNVELDPDELAVSIDAVEVEE
jgi:hypothetical protein